MSQPSRLLRIADAGATVALIGVSAWGLLGIVLGLAWLIKDQPDWSVVGAVWLLAFWFLAALGVVCRYWVVRYLFRREGRPPYIMGSPTGIYQVTAHGWGLPGVTVVAVIREVDGAPLWMVLLGVGVVAIGLGAFVDGITVARRAARRGRSHHV